MGDQGALNGVCVLDLTHNVAGPYCTKLLAGLGAEVIKIEVPTVGDPLRLLSPNTDDGPGLESRGFFTHLNTGKKSVALDLKSVQGNERFLHLARSADIVVESFAPGTMARLGLAFDELQQANRGIILTSISNFGQHGPYRDYHATEIVFMALGGFMYVTGDPDREPVKLCGVQGQYQAGLQAAIGTLAALHHREETRAGQWVDVSIAESVAFLAPRTDPTLPGFSIPMRSGNRNGGGRPAGPYPSTTLPCKDGFVHVHSKHWAPDALAKLMGEPRLAAPEVLKTPAGHADEIDSLMQPWLLERTKMQVLREAQAQAVPFGAALDMQEVLEDPQHAARGYFVSVHDPELGDVTVTGAPMRLSRTPWVTSRAPLLGEHREEVLAVSSSGFRVSGHDVNSNPETRNPKPALPLSRLRVLDLTQILAGPTATQVLADLGAEVIKIESHTRPDRSSGDHGVLHRNKLGLCLNLATASGIALFKRLASAADVVIDNFSPRVMGKLGLDYPVLSAINPGIIQVSMPAFGTTGPYKDFVMVGPGIDAMSGLQQINGYPDRSPLKAGGGYTDQTTALNAVVAILAALQWRRSNGEGQRIEVAMREAVTPLIGEYIADHSINGRLPARWGNRSPTWAPQGCYRCSGADNWIALSIRTDTEWRTLCTVIDRPDLAADPRYATVADRRRNHDLLDPIIEAWAAQRESAQAMTELQSAGIPAGRVSNPLEVFQDPQMRARGHFEPGPNPEGGRSFYPMLGFRLPASPVTVRRPPCAFGEHTQVVLRDLLGLSTEQIGALYQEGTIADAPVRTRSDLPSGSANPPRRSGNDEHRLKATHTGFLSVGDGRQPPRNLRGNPRTRRQRRRRCHQPTT